MGKRLKLFIQAPARLHLGFIDLHGGMGRRYGGVGVALSEPRLQISMRSASRLLVRGANGKEALALKAHTFAERSGLNCRAEIEAQQIIPPHQGLGSGTQTCMAVGAGLAKLQGAAMDNQEIARAMGRGRRSGIGIGAFSHGGLLVDGGKRTSSARPPPLIARHKMPEAWRVMLLSRSGRQGISGSFEQSAFDKLPDFPVAYAEFLSRLLMMKLMPAAVEEDFLSFAEAVDELQKVIGDYFSFIQNDRYGDELILKALRFLQSEGVAGIGQSSWGPTGFAFAANKEQALRLQDTIKRRFSELQTSVVSFNNRGALLRTET